MKAIFNNKVIAESDKTIELESNQYFPPESVKTEYLKESGNTYVCPWKGEAKYYDVEVDGEVAKDGAWVYPDPSEEATKAGIKGYFGFWNGVEVGE